MIGRGTAVFLAALAAAQPAVAGPLEDAHAALDGWSADYSFGDLDALMRSYWPDATLFGDKAPDLANGHAAIRRYYAQTRRNGEHNRIGRRHSIVLGPDAVLITGYYEFLVPERGRSVSAPARFTILLTRRDGAWRIAHHHSSAYVEAKP